MRKQVFGRKFKRDANERRALLKGLMNDLVLKEHVKTTEEKAKAIKGQIEKLVTKAKNKGQAAESLLQPYLTVAAYEKVINDLAKRFANRPGGYLRIIKLGKRFGDNAKMVIIEWVEKTSALVASSAEETKKPSKANRPVRKAKSVGEKPAKPAVKKSAKAAKK